MNFKSVFLSYESCKVYDNFRIRRCKNCCGYNHSYKKCKESFKRPQTCVKCNGNHDSKSCSAENKMCINCINANKYLDKKRDVNHSADDIDSCETYKVKWEQYINDTNYPYRPEPPFKIE